MSLSTLPLSYCTNVHPGQSVAEIERDLDRYSVPIRDRYARPLAAGLWLARPVVSELVGQPDLLSRFAENLDRRALTCHTLNAFPYGDFHATRVKEKVFQPDWTRPERLEYTRQCAAVLAHLLPPNTDGSISTLPLGLKGWNASRDFINASIGNLLELTTILDELHQSTGKVIRLAIEPEPFGVVETTGELIEFFHQLRRAAAARGLLEAVNTYLGVCFDVCHQAVQFENIAEAIGQLDDEAIRINKLHITCALQLDDPIENAEGRAALSRYIEPRYFHQTTAQLPDGSVVRAPDLTEQLIADPGEDFLKARMWRIHFHVPVDAERMGPLRTTRPAISEAIKAVAALGYSPHLEVETYTWEVMPDAGYLIDGLARELRTTDELINRARKF